MKQLAFALMLVSGVAHAQFNDFINVYSVLECDDYQLVGFKIRYGSESGPAMVSVGNGGVEPWEYSQPEQRHDFYLPQECCTLHLMWSGNGDFTGSFRLYLFDGTPLIPEITWFEGDSYYVTFSYGDCEQSSSCPSDINGDGLVGVGDLIIFMAEYGSTCN